MNQNDLEVFSCLLAKLKIAFNQTLSTKETEAQAEIYFEALKDYSARTLTRAVDLVIQELKFFPRVVEIRERAARAIEETPDDLRIVYNTQGQIEYRDKNYLSPEEAKKALDKIYEVIEEGREASLVEREKKFEENRERLRVQSKLVLGGEGP